MPKNHDQDLSILELVKQLLINAVDWCHAEIALTRLDMKSLIRRYMVGVGLIFTSFAILIAAIFTLAQTVIGALSSYLYGHTIAGLVVSVVLFILALLIIFGARYFFFAKTKSKGLIFKRIMAGTSE